MKRAALALALLGAPALSGCLIIDADDEGYAGSYQYNTPGTVFGAAVNPDTVDFLVSSNGCTDKTYFEVDVDRRGDDGARVELRRIRTDNCRAFVPDGARVSWSYAELGLDPGMEVTVSNAVSRN